MHSSIMSVVLLSATKAELGALFYNAKDTTAFRVTLDELGHIQPPTPIQTDHACASGIANKSIKQRRSKAIDMRFYWVKDCVEQKQFIIYWRPGLTNLADYFSKHHSPAHHRKMRSHYLLEQSPTNDKAILICREGVLIQLLVRTTSHQKFNRPLLKAMSLPSHTQQITAPLENCNNNRLKRVCGTKGL
jgi:hypothetical protein